MSRQYMSTFRNKLNPNPHQFKRDLISPNSNESFAAKSLFRDLKPNGGKNPARKEERKKSQKFDEARASSALTKSKIQVEILETALEDLREKEKRALRELESEMRRYRRSVVSGNRTYRKTNLSRYSWQNIFPSLENEDVVLKRRGQTLQVQSGKSNPGTTGSQK